MGNESMITQADTVSAGIDPAPVLDPVVEELIRVSEALNADCQFEAADRTVTEAMRSRPDDARTAEQYTLLALQRGDWREAVRRAEALRGAFPDYQAGYRCGIEAETELLRVGKALELQAESARRFPDESWPLMHAANLAELSQNFELAERRRALVCSRFPCESAGWHAWAATRMRAGRLEGAEQVVTDALQRFPDDPELYGLRATIAARSGQREKTEECWRVAAERFPNDPEVAQRNAEAPVEFPIGKRWDEARSRYEELNRKFPEFALGYVRHVQLLVRAADIDGAEELARAARNRLRDSIEHADVTVELARILERKGNVEGAVTLLKMLLNEVPNAIGAYGALSTLLSRQSRYEEAEEVCKRAIARFKFRAPPLIDYAKIATAKGDLDEALTRWKRAFYFASKEPTIARELFISRLAVAEKQSPIGDGDALLAVGSERSSGPVTSLMMNFESLGGPGGGGCEFGFVQRNFGAEPIGLLRWASLSTENLIKALQERFEGLGTREQTELRLPGLENGATEYVVFDTRFKIAMNTFVSRDAMAAEKLLDQWCGRLAFLRRKLISDLELGTKMFLYRPGVILNESQITRLGAAVRSYGDNNVLLIQTQEAGSANGTVKWLSPGMMVGYLDRLNWEPGRASYQPSYAHWARICANALALCTEAKE